MFPTSGNNRREASGPEDEEILVIEGLGNRTYAFTRRAIKHIIVGAILGFVLSLTLSSILYESAKNSMFAVVDVIVLLASAIALFLKQESALDNNLKSLHHRGSNPINPGDIESNTNALSFEKPFDRMLAVVRLGGGVCMFSALAVILIIATSLPPALKLFLTMSVGTAHCFLLCLACVEAFNRLFNNGTPLIARQLYTVAINSLAIGCLSGFMFGAADVENDYYRLGWEQWVTASICIICGALIGHANAYASNDEEMDIAFDPLPMGDDAGNGGDDENNNNNNTSSNVMNMNDDPYSTVVTNAGPSTTSSSSGLTGTLPPPSSSSTSTNGGVSLGTINFPSSSNSSLVPRNNNNNSNGTKVTTEGSSNGNGNGAAAVEPSVPKPDW